MDAGGSPQAETRWSDPITLHQGSAGEGVSWLQSVPYTLRNGRARLPPPPPAPRCRGTGCLVAVFKSGEPFPQAPVLGVGHWLCPTPHVCHSWGPRPQLIYGRQQPSLPMGSQPGPSFAGGEERPKQGGQSVRAPGSGRLPSAGPREASMRHQAEDTACVKTRRPVWVTPGRWAAGAGEGAGACMPGSREQGSQWSGFRSAAAGCARGGHFGGNSLEGETRVEAGAMGGPGYRAQMPL